MDFAGKGQPLADADMQAALAAMDLDAAHDLPVLWAVLTVESRGFGFLADRRPKILFERHIFFRETAGRFAAAAALKPITWPRPQLALRSAGSSPRPSARHRSRARASREYSAAPPA